MRQNVRYLHNELSYVEVQPGRFTTTGAGATLRLVDGRTITRSYFSTNENLNTFAADNQLQAKFNMGPLQHTVLAGLDYQRFDFNNFARFAGLPPTRSTSWRRTTPRTSPSPRRSSRTSTSTCSSAASTSRTRRGSAGSPCSAASATTGPRAIRWRRTLGVRVLNDDQKPTGRIGAIYNFDTGIAPYVSYSTSFQPTSVGTLLNGQPFKPTTGEQYEGGVKYQPVGTNLMFTAAVYDLKQQNVATIISWPRHSGQHHRRRSARSASRGFEGSVVGSPLPGLSLRGQYSYLDNRITARPGRQFRQAARQRADAHRLALGQLFWCRAVLPPASASAAASATSTTCTRPTPTI